MELSFPLIANIPSTTQLYSTLLERREACELQLTLTVNYSIKHTSVSVHRNILTSANDIMDNQESTSSTLNGGAHLPDGLFPHVLLRHREVKDENASLREDKAAKRLLIKKQQESLIVLETRHTALLTEHNALQTGHFALLTGHRDLQYRHGALLTRYGALQTKYIALLTRLRSLVSFGWIIVVIGMVFKKAVLSDSPCSCQFCVWFGAFFTK